MCASTTQETFFALNPLQTRSDERALNPMRKNYDLWQKPTMKQ